MKSKSVYLLLQLALFATTLAALSSCNHDDNVTRRKGMHITLMECHIRSGPTEAGLLNSRSDDLAEL